MTKTGTNRENWVEPLKVVKTRSGLRVVYTAPIDELGDPLCNGEDRSIGDRHYDYATMGCPALINVGNGVAAKKLWHYVVNEADKHALFNAA
jgi:hypothetical protein